VLQRGREVAFTVPPESWIRDRVAKIQELLERKTDKSALLIRRLLGPIRLLPASTQSGHSYLRAETTLSVLPLIENEPASQASEAVSNALQWWTRSERIRTASEVNLEFPLTEAEVSLYQRFAPEIARLRRLGLSRHRIGEALGIDDKTVAKAIRWRHVR
jgi:hypothetical protein